MCRSSRDSCAGLTKTPAGPYSTDRSSPAVSNFGVMRRLRSTLSSRPVRGMRLVVSGPRAPRYRHNSRLRHGSRKRKVLPMRRLGGCWVHDLGPTPAQSTPSSPSCIHIDIHVKRFNSQSHITLSSTLSCHPLSTSEFMPNPLFALSFSICFPYFSFLFNYTPGYLNTPTTYQSVVCVSQEKVGR